MKIKSMMALVLSGLLAVLMSAPLFADDASVNATDNAQSTDQSASGMSDDSKKSDANNGDAAASKSTDEEGSQDTATGDDDY